MSRPTSDIPLHMGNSNGSWAPPKDPHNGTRSWAPSMDTGGAPKKKTVEWHQVWFDFSQNTSFAGIKQVTEVQPFLIRRWVYLFIFSYITALKQAFNVIHWQRKGWVFDWVMSKWKRSQKCDLLSLGGDWITSGLHLVVHDCKNVTNGHPRIAM